MKVLAVRDPTTPNVAVQVWYGVGSKDDPEGRSGFAHLFEHLMFKATRNMPAETLDRLTEDVGGYNNAGTADDYTQYDQVVPANHLERILWAEAERMGSLVVDEAVFRSERDVVKEELRQNVLATPYGRLFSLFLPTASYQAHPYRRPGIGSIEELDAATLDDVRAFHRDHYRPDNALLVVVGAFEPAQLDVWVDRYFGPMTNPSRPRPIVKVVEPRRAAPGVFEGAGPNVPLPAVVITWQGPAARDADAPALKVLDAVLSAGKSSRLYDTLVYEKQIAVEAFSNADLPADPGLFLVGAIAAGGHDIPELEAALLAEVARLRDAPPTPAELAEAKNELLAGALRERETIEGRASALGYAAIVTGDPAAANTELAQLQAVTAEDVQRVARRYLAEDRRMSIRYRAEAPGASQTATVAATPGASTPYDGPIVTLADEAQRVRPPAPGPQVPATLPTAEERTLANGLRVIVARSSDLPLVTADLSVRAGVWADPRGKAGATAMMAGLLTEGTKTRSARDIARRVESLGATLSSGAGQEAVSVTLSALPDTLDETLVILADVARNPAFAAEELDRQRDQALDGLSVAYRQPAGLAGAAIAPVVFAGTPLGRASQGTPESLKQLNRQDLVRLHVAAFRPDNAVLVLTGDITPEVGFALAERTFGGWRAPTAPLPAAPAIQPSTKPRAVAIDLPKADQASVNVVRSAVSRGDPDYYPALVAATVLGGGYSARLNQEIRIKRGLSYGAGARLASGRAAGSFQASAQTKTESVVEVLGLINAELARLGSEPAGPDELAARKSTLIGGYGRALATSGGLADILGELALTGTPLEELGRYTDRVQAVDAEQVRAHARRGLDPAATSVIIAGDAALFAPALKALRPDLAVIPVDRLYLESPSLTR